MCLPLVALSIHFPLNFVQYITAVLQGPNGEPQYISLPADPRVLSGQYSYAMLQQPDGSQSIVLVENNTNSKWEMTLTIR